MRALVVAAVLCLGCTVVLAQTGDGGGSAAAAAAQSMYEDADVVGVLMNTNSMYQDRDTSWHLARLRIDEVAKGSEPQVGQILRVNYPTSAGAKAPRVGDQVRASIRQQPVVTGRAPLWVAVKAPEVLGRGDFVRPGKGAEVDLGSPKARILVKMFAPRGPECHKKTAQLLMEFVQREPERVRVQIFNMGSPAGREETVSEGLSCATVLVNNRYEFTLIEADGERKVALHHKPNEPKSSYRSEDVIAVVEQELKRLYP